MKKRAFALITALCMTLTCFASAETVKHERVYAVTNADGDALTVIDNAVLSGMQTAIFNLLSLLVHTGNAMSGVL